MERLYTKSDFARLAGVSPSAVTKGIRDGRIVVSHNAAGRERINIDLDANKRFLADDSTQRTTGMSMRGAEPFDPHTRQPDPESEPDREPEYEQIAVSEQSKAVAKAASTPPSKIKPIPYQPPKMPKTTRVTGDEGNGFDLALRKQKALTERTEHQAQGEALKNAKTRGDLVSREVVYDQMISYLDKLHANIERLADSYLSDVGGRIVDAGSVTPELRAEWKDEVMAMIDETKKSMVDELKRIAREMA